ncbi:MAG: Txe/YoeB family addiction module toxin [Verrucomicrobiaceae bacterium]|nr:Txe/YoeB family addiction module toxin [Verrucomicrobiaceae bacterium]
MTVAFTPEAWEQYIYWQQTDKAMMKRINRLIQELARTPFTGTGKPEALKHNLAGWWSRRIDEEHRIVYQVDGDKLVISRCRHHYAS